MNNITETIDQILTHHYFLQKLQQLIPTINSPTYTALEDQYYTSEHDLISELADTMTTVFETRMHKAITKQFIVLNEEMVAMRREVYSFMEEQHALTAGVKKDIARIAEDAKRKNAVFSSMGTNNSISNSNSNLGSNGINSAIRFSRSGNTATEGKSFYSELASLKKEVQQLKTNIVNQQGLQILRDQLNQFRIETKVNLQSLKQQQKKTTIACQSLKNPNPSSSSSQDQHIENLVKRSIKSQSSVLQNYSDKLFTIQARVDNFDEKLDQHGEMHQEYLSNQLKSIWLVVNDVKRTVDLLIEHTQMHDASGLI